MRHPEAHLADCRHSLARSLTDATSCVRSRPCYRYAGPSLAMARSLRSFAACMLGCERFTHDYYGTRHPALLQLPATLMYSLFCEYESLRGTPIISETAVLLLKFARPMLDYPVLLQYFCEAAWAQAAWAQPGPMGSLFIMHAWLVRACICARPWPVNQ